MDGKKIITKLWEVEKLVGAEYNPREITDKQFDELQDSIKRFGFVDPIIVNVSKERHGIIIAGHQRTRVAKSLGMDKIPAVELDLTLEQERELNVRHNKSGGKFDMDALANFFEVDELMDWGFEEWELGMADDVNIDDFFEDKEEEGETGEPVDEKVKIILEYTEEEHEKVINALSELGQTPEQAIWKLLNLGE